MEILIGNELTTGAAVYLDKTGRWVMDLQAARLFDKEDAEARDAAIAASKATGHIVSLEIETVNVVDGVLVPVRLRERIRSSGPTIGAYGRQHLSEDAHVSI